MEYFECEPDDKLEKVNCIKWMDRGKVEVYLDDDHLKPARVDEFFDEAQLRNSTARTIFKWVMHRPAKVF